MHGICPSCTQLEFHPSPVPVALPSHLNRVSTEPEEETECEEGDGRDHEGGDGSGPSDVRIKIEPSSPMNGAQLQSNTMDYTQLATHELCKMLETRGIFYSWNDDKNELIAHLQKDDGKKGIKSGGIGGGKLQPSMLDYTQFDVRTLEKMLENRGLNMFGNRDRLIARLGEDDSVRAREEKEKVESTKEKQGAESQSNFPDCSQLTLLDLQNILLMRGLATTGNRDALIARLQADNREKEKVKEKAVKQAGGGIGEGKKEIQAQHDFLDFSQVPRPHLQRLAELSGLDTSGTRSELIARLQEASRKKLTGKAESSGLGEAKQAAQSQTNIGDYSNFTLQHLQQMLTIRGLNKSGNKHELIARLQENDRAKENAGGVKSGGFISGVEGGKDYFFEMHIKQLEQKLEEARLRDAEKNVEITTLKSQVRVLAQNSVREGSQFAASVGESPLRPRANGEQVYTSQVGGRFKEFDGRAGLGYAAREQDGVETVHKNSHQVQPARSQIPETRSYGAAGQGNNTQREVPPAQGQGNGKEKFAHIAAITFTAPLISLVTKLKSALHPSPLEEWFDKQIKYTFECAGEGDFSKMVKGYRDFVDFVGLEIKQAAQDGIMDVGAALRECEQFVQVVIDVEGLL